MTEQMIAEFITEQAMILVPVLLILGLAIKKIEKIKNKYIPIILLVFGVVLANLYLGFSIEASIQGVLVVGLAVFVHQLKIQAQKTE